MRPTHRLDVLIVPEDPDARPLDQAHQLLDTLVADGVVLGDGRPGPEAARWMPESFGRLFVDAPEGVALFANRQGGFRVRCPDTSDNVATAFTAAVGAWRAGGPRTLACPSCGAVHPLEALDAAPPFAFASVALVTADAAGLAPTPEALSLVARALGPVRTMHRRG